MIQAVAQWAQWPDTGVGFGTSGRLHEPAGPLTGVAGTTFPVGPQARMGKKVIVAGRSYPWLTASLIRRVATPVAPQPAVGSQRSPWGDGPSCECRSRNMPAAFRLTNV